MYFLLRFAFTCSKCPSIFNCQRSMLLLTANHNKLMVGLGRIELPTSPLSGVRSSQLSYRPGGLSQSWWSWSGSNRRPPECKSGALPTELQPLICVAQGQALPRPAPKLYRGRLNAESRDQLETQDRKHFRKPD